MKACGEIKSNRHVMASSRVGNAQIQSHMHDTIKQFIYMKCLFLLGACQNHLDGPKMLNDSLALKKKDS